MMRDRSEFLPAFLSALKSFLAFSATFCFLASGSFLTAAYGLTRSMALAFLSGLHLRPRGFWPCLGALRTDWTSSELMMRDRSEFFICIWGRRVGVPLCLRVDDGRVIVPKTVSSFSKAPCVHTQKRPRWPPGASCSRLSELTSASSTPGMLRKARVMPLSWL